ncbi:MAG: GreA/GreB family elongation factor [Spirochaetes bacterium]|nr:GreA/GreB family elongation factor [Spirochaetota bacterium]
MFKKYHSCITKFDYVRLLRILKNNIYSRANRNFSANIEKLKKRMRKAKKVDSKTIEPDYITMNSVFELKDLGKPGNYKYRLVFPGDANEKEGNISILSANGTAVFGCREGEIIKWDTVADEKYCQISKIIYQPEAAGDYHL